MLGYGCSQNLRYGTLTIKQLITNESKLSVKIVTPRNPQSGHNDGPYTYEFLWHSFRTLQWRFAYLKSSWIYPWKQWRILITKPLIPVLIWILMMFLNQWSVCDFVDYTGTWWWSYCTIIQNKLEMSDLLKSIIR